MNKELIKEIMDLILGLSLLINSIYLFINREIFYGILSIGLQIINLIKVVLK